MRNKSVTPLDVARLLTQVAHRLMRDIHQHLRHYYEGPRVTMPQMRVLHMASQDAPTLSDVADALRVTRPTATRLVDGLVQRGWLTREIDPQDRRRIRLRTTPEGRRILAHVQEAVHASVSERLARLAPADLEALFRGLQALEQVLREQADLSPEACVEGGVPTDGTA